MNLRCDTRPREHRVLTIGSRRRRDTDKTWPIENEALLVEMVRWSRAGAPGYKRIHAFVSGVCLCLGVWGNEAGGVRSPADLRADPGTLDHRNVLRFTNDALTLAVTLILALVCTSQLTLSRNMPALDRTPRISTVQHWLIVDPRMGLDVHRKVHHCGERALLWCRYQGKRSRGKGNASGLYRSTTCASFQLCSSTAPLQLETHSDPLGHRPWRVPFDRGALQEVQSLLATLRAVTAQTQELPLATDKSA
jgi:hypothetical protein